MADIKSPEQRSQNMAKIRSKDTKPEEYIRHLLFSRGYRYRKNVASVPGHPDAWLAKYNVALFVHGCFWHRHPGCKYAYTPKSRVEFWNRKFESNIARDKVVEDQLQAQGIRSLVIWECTVRQMRKDKAKEAEIVERIEEFLPSDMNQLEL